MSSSQWEEYFNNIYEDNRVSLQRFLLCLTKNHEDAADLLQDTFLRFYEQEIYPHCTKSWLNRTGYRIFIDQWRKNKRVQWVRFESSHY